MPNLIITTMSKVQSFPFERLLECCRNAFKSFGVSDHCIYDHITRVKHLAEYMDREHIPKYTPEIGEKYLAYLNGCPDCSVYRKITDKRTIRYIDMYLRGETYKRYIKDVKVYRCSDTELGRHGNEYIEHITTVKRLSSGTLRGYRYAMYLFTTYMDTAGFSTSELSRRNILEFVASCPKYKETIVQAVRGFLSYLFDNGHIDRDLTPCIKGVSYDHQEPIISYYTPEEINKIEKSINRNTVTGKRNYAMVLLATRLGLRSSDIVSLEFSNIDWDKNTISIIQKKTQKALTLPLLADVGDAIIDYVMNGRPHSDVKNIFLSTNRPYTAILTFGTIVNRCITNADVHIPAQRRKGSHSLRHSLATALMNTGSEMPVISEVLGHRSTESTMTYLGVNISLLLECSLDVPPVDSQFYNQKGGIFYE